MYTLNSDSTAIIRDADGATIPMAPGNRDYQEYLEWVAAGNMATPYSPPPISADEVEAERTRRLELGFDYDFGDARGIHHVGTVVGDTVGWNEVTQYANALIDSGDTTTTIAIATNSARHCHGTGVAGNDADRCRTSSTPMGQIVCAAEYGPYTCGLHR